MPEKIKLFEPSSLEEVVAGIAEQFATQSTWVSTLVGSFASIIRRRPLVYRSFRPFWLPIKAMMRDRLPLLGNTPLDGRRENGVA